MILFASPPKALPWAGKSRPVGGFSVVLARMGFRPAERPFDIKESHALSYSHRSCLAMDKKIAERRGEGKFQKTVPKNSSPKTAFFL